VGKSSQEEDDNSQKEVNKEEKGEGRVSSFGLLLAYCVFVLFVTGP